MPRTRYSEYSATPGDNTDIDGINIGEGMAPSDVNNSLRSFLSQTRDFIDGSSGDTLTSAKIVVTTAEILSGVNVTGTATFNSAVILSSSVTGSALSLSGALTVGGATILSSSLGVTGTASMGVIDATTLEVTNLKAKDGTASATIADATGVMTVASAVLTTADINGGTLDNTVIGGATPAAGTFTTGTATTFTATTVDSTNLEVTNLKAKDGTSAGSIADSTGVVTLASAVLTTADINGGTADNVVIGGGTAAAGTFTTATATTGNITNVNATTVDSTNLEVTNIKAKDGTAAATIADSTGVVTIPSAVLTTADINGGTVDNAAVGAGTPSTGAFTTLSSNSTTTLNGTTIPASKTLLVSTDIGSTVQGYDADTAKYDDVTANFTGTLQNGGSNVLVDTDIGTNVQAYDAQLADVAGLTPADGAFIVGDGANFVAESGATARTSLGLGSISTQAADNVNIDGGAVDGITLGTNSAVTEAQIDNVNINGNAIVSSDTDGDLSLTPNGTGDLILDGLKWPQADGTADYVLKTDGSGQLSWTEQTGGGGTPGGSDTQIQYNSGGSFAGASGLVTDGSNLTLNAQGDLRFADSDSSNWVAFQAPATIASNVTWTLPSADGSNGQVLSTNGSGTLSWASGGGGGSSISAGDSSVEVTDTGSDGTITFDTDGSERMRINSSGSVGLAVTPASWNTVNALQVKNASFAGYSTTNAYMLQNAYYASGWKYISNGGATRLETNGSSLAFSAAASGTADNAITFTELLVVAKDKTLALQGATLNIAGTGITFPATQSACADANTLDDYEEGTWTPVLSRTGSSYTLDRQFGIYTKVGNIVTCTFSLDIASIGTQGTSYNILSGFPFTPTNYGGAARSQGLLSWKTVLTSATTFYYAGAWFFADGTSALQTNFTTGELSGTVIFQV
jgi:hypothetical protein